MRSRETDNEGEKSLPLLLEEWSFHSMYFLHFFFSLVFQIIYVHGRGSLFPERSSVPTAYILFDVMILVAVEMIKLSSTGFRWGISAGRWYNIPSFMQICEVKSGKQTNKHNIEANTLPSLESLFRLGRLFWKSTSFVVAVRRCLECVTHRCGSAERN